MGTRDELARRADVRPEDIDEIIGRATELQERRRAEGDAVSVADVQRVAAELDVDPAFVDKAIAQLETERARALQEAAHAAARQRVADEQTAEQRAFVGKIVGAVAIVIALAVLGLAATGATAASAAAQEVRLAEVAFAEVTDRQADLAGQLVALAGADAAGIPTEARRVHEAADMDARMAAARALHQAMAERMGSLPPTDSEAVAQQRLNLQHEVVGSWNRVEAASRALREARSDAAAVHRRTDVAIARAIGLAGTSDSP